MAALVTIMGSIGMRDWERCSCGRSKWPLRSEHCAVCLDRQSQRGVLAATSRSGLLGGEDALDIVCDFLAMAPGSLGRTCWRKCYLLWVLCTPGSNLRRLTYAGNGLAGSIDEKTDILDMVLFYCCGSVTAAW